MISLIPCYSLEDFSIYRKASEVDEIFSAWSALYHPALVAHFDEAPRWEAAGSPSTGKPRRLVVVPPCAEYLVSRSWLKSAEEEGAVVIRHVADRDAILAEAFYKLGIDPRPNAQEKQTNDEIFASSPQNATSKTPTIPPYRYDDDAETFLAVGLCCLLEELLTRKLRYMSNLDQISFNTRVVDAAKAHMKGDVEEREKNLQKAFDLLAQAKEYFFPTATKFFDLTWTRDEDLEKDLPAMLEKRRLRKEQTNLVLPVPVLKSCEKNYPETLRILREELKAERVKLIGGDEWEAPLYLMSPLEIAREIKRGREEYLRVLGEAPVVFGREEAGYAQIMPQILKMTGYRGALARTGDGWTLLEKKTDRSQIRWQGRDGSTIAAICKQPVDASAADDILQLPDKIGNSYYSDDASAVVFEHRPNKESRWLRDLTRMDRYSPVLGKFYNINDYLRVTEGSGDKEKFIKDRFKTNFLTRSVKRSRQDVVSLWPKRRRLGLASAALSQLETMFRVLTFKVRKDVNKRLEPLFCQYVENTAALREKIEETLKLLDERLLPVEVEKSEIVDFDRRFKELEASKDALLRDAGKFLSLALESSDQKHDDDFPLELEDKRGFLVVNTSPVPQDFLWETRDSADSSLSNAGRNEQLLVKTLREKLADQQDVSLRVFSDDSSSKSRYCATIPPNSALWTPRFDGLEYRFISRPLFETDEGPAPLIKSDPSDVENVKPQETEKKEPPGESFLQKFVSKLRGDVVNSASSASSESNVGKRLLAEYVEHRYSSTEIERFYALRNDYFELRVDPATGAVKRLTTFNANATFSNGVLRQPTLGNRFAWDVSFKLPKNQRSQDGRPENDPFYGYTIPAADVVSVIDSGPGLGRLQIEGRMVAPSGEVAGTFRETLTTRLRSRVIDVDLEITPILEPDSAPWDSYYACRFAWKDALADIRGGVAASLIGTARDYLQAPECVDIRSEENVGVTILSAGTPYFKKVGDSRMDAILIPKGETRKNFRFGVGIDLDNPHDVALSYADVPPFIVEDAPCPRRMISRGLSVSNQNVKILEETPIIENAIEEKTKSPIKRVNDGFVGVRATLLETKSEATETSLRSLLPISRVEAVDLIGVPTREKIAVKNGTLIPLTFKPRQLRVLELYF